MANKSQTSWHPFLFGIVLMVSVCYHSNNTEFDVSTLMLVEVRGKHSPQFKNSHFKARIAKEILRSLRIWQTFYWVLFFLLNQLSWLNKPFETIFVISLTLQQIILFLIWNKNYHFPWIETGNGGFSRIKFPSLGTKVLLPG